MRVITGSAKGMRLISPKGNAIRPTSDRIKEALFSILGDKVINCVFLDGFAGTGSIGIEALSRGADKCFFIDNKRESLYLINENLIHTKLSDKAELVNKDFVNAIKLILSFDIKMDIIFLDPPYIENCIQPALSAISQNNILNENGIIIIEHSKEDIIEKYEKLICYRQKKYGNTILSFYEQEEI